MKPFKFLTPPSQSIDNQILVNLEEAFRVTRALRLRIELDEKLIKLKRKILVALGFVLLEILFIINEITSKSSVTFKTITISFFSIVVIFLGKSLFDLIIDYKNTKQKRDRI